jgi:flagellar biosynthetic protein FlhB
MADETERSSRTEEPTQRRLDEARRKGDVVKSADVPALASLAGAAAVLVFAGGGNARGMAAALTPFLAHPEQIDLSGGGAVAVMRAALMASLPAVLVLAAAALAGAAGNLVQHGFLWAPAKVAPELSKLDPLQGLKRLFGLENLVNFLKSLAKLGAVCAIAWFVLKPRIGAFENLPALDPAAILPYSAEVLRSLVAAVLAFTAGIAGLDWFLARQRFMARMRMTREEIKQDQRDSEGDPHVKGKQKQLRMIRARQRMIQNVPQATVVVTNPTHYAVALRYDRNETAAPVCVAKGVDRVALKIREVAEAAGVPVIEDPPLARALYATIDVDEVIPREHYHAVAQIIGFVMGAGARSSSARRSAPSLRP